MNAVLLAAAPLAMAQYTHLQYIGWPMQTGYNAFVSSGGLYYGEDGGIGIYAGKHDTTADIDARVSLMRDALLKVAASPDIDKRPSTLKIFAAPEFFFRGAIGAYPLGDDKGLRAVQGLAKKLNALIAGDEWRDWVCFFGTTIGYKPSHPSTVESAPGARRPLLDTYNFALVQRGGPGGERHVHFKTYISSIDFLDATPGTDGTVTFPDMNVSRAPLSWPKPMRKVTKVYPLISGAVKEGLERVVGRPVAAPRFEMANVSFCLDICLDHGMGVCAKALDKEKAEGKGPGLVSVHAIVSAGMRINPLHVRVPAGGSALLADGLGAGAQQSLESHALPMASHVHPASPEEARASYGEAAVIAEARRAGVAPNLVLDDDYQGKVKSTPVEVLGPEWKARVNGVFAVQRYGAAKPPWDDYSYGGAAEEAWAFVAEVKPEAHVFATVPIVRP